MFARPYGQWLLGERRYARDLVAVAYAEMERSRPIVLRPGHQSRRVAVAQYGAAEIVGL